jgi:hypothetical protein
MPLEPINQKPTIYAGESPRTHEPPAGYYDVGKNYVLEHLPKNHNSSDLELGLFVLPIVPFPKAAFTPDRFDGDAGVMKKCALEKLRINTGACLKGVRINDYTEPGQRLLEPPKLSTKYLRIYKWIGGDREKVLYIEVTEDNILEPATLQEDAEYFATYETINHDYGESKKYESDTFRVRVYDNQVALRGPQNRNVVFIDTVAKLNDLFIPTDGGRSPFQNHLSPLPLESQDSAPEGVYLIICVNMVTLPPGINRLTFPHGKYSGVLDGGWFINSMNWGHVRHCIPFQPASEPLFGELRRTHSDSGSPFWIYSLRYCHNMDRYTGTITHELTYKTTKELEHSYALTERFVEVASVFLTVNSGHQRMSNAYLVDLDFGRPRNFQKPMDAKVILTLKNPRIDVDHRETKCIGISWYGSANAFINCFPMHFEAVDEINEQINIDNKMDTQLGFFIAIGKGNICYDHELGILIGSKSMTKHYPMSVFMACGNTNPQHILPNQTEIVTGTRGV